MPKGIRVTSCRKSDTRKKVNGFKNKIVLTPTSKVGISISRRGLLKGTFSFAKASSRTKFAAAAMRPSTSS